MMLAESKLECDCIEEKNETDVTSKIKQSSIKIEIIFDKILLLFSIRA